uniref:Evolutionarily conserved signaling intermediate in Toll pathway, mitochondrial n=1 Tax=Glossina morsitans morsitans TaxID=37546 RepID=A0A1B0G104_GLOMM
MSMVEIFTERDIRRRNHVEFIYAALKHMAEFGVERDLDVYKALINVLPKGKFIPVPGVFETKNVVDAIDDTWIVSGMSPDQTQLLHKHPYNKAIYIEGPFLIWLRSRTINYFTLRADPDVEFLKSLNSNTEDEDDVTKLRVPSFGQPPISSKNHVDYLLSWIRLFEANGNPVLSQIPVLFRFRSKISDKVKEIESNN